MPTGAAEFGFTLFDSIEAALCCGGDTLAVDAVLMVSPNDFSPQSKNVLAVPCLIELAMIQNGEHGDCKCSSSL